MSAIQGKCAQAEMSEMAHILMDMDRVVSIAVLFGGLAITIVVLLFKKVESDAGMDILRCADACE